jgi:GNAT superfamily N-acetyltransferase
MANGTYAAKGLARELHPGDKYLATLLLQKDVPVAWAILFHHGLVSDDYALGMIGVYTEPIHRHQGYAQLCLQELLGTIQPQIERLPKSNKITYLAQDRIVQWLRTLSSQPVLDRYNEQRTIVDRLKELHRCRQWRRANDPLQAPCAQTSF